MRFRLSLTTLYDILMQTPGKRIAQQLNLPANVNEIWKTWLTICIKYLATLRHTLTDVKINYVKISNIYSLITPTISNAIAKVLSRKFWSWKPKCSVLFLQKKNFLMNATPDCLFPMLILRTLKFLHSVLGQI